jgi:hypothetical protein
MRKNMDNTREIKESEWLITSGQTLSQHIGQFIKSGLLEVIEFSYVGSWGSHYTTYNNYEAQCWVRLPKQTQRNNLIK